MNSINLCWIRRDLRLSDHHALSQSLKDCEKTYIVFVFDPNILDKLKEKKDRRVTFIIDSLKDIEEKLQELGSSLIILYGKPEIEIPKLISELKINKLFYNRDYEPYAKKRDEKVSAILKKMEVEVFNFKDHVFYEKHEVLSGSREIYKVFTPYKNKWIENFKSQESIIPSYKPNLSNLAKFNNTQSILKKDWFKIIGFIPTENELKGGEKEAKKRLNAFKKIMSNYATARDIPSLNQTSNLSPYIRMGNISIRELIKASLESSSLGHQVWLSELIWREFYQVILDVFPKVEKNCFKSDYDKIKWIGKKEHFKKWCEGNTGYPIVDAAMRCLNQTGMMHNRLRMIVASFLTKTLLIDWREGEEYFAINLLDFDLAANNGGWQWSASTGVDAQPYFRIFNPYNQSEKFDPDGIFIRQWCPELKNFTNKQIHYPHESDLVEQVQANCFIGKDYPHPIVSYKVQKEMALAMFKQIGK